MVLLSALNRFNPGGIYFFKVNNRNTQTTCDICLKLKRKTPEHCQLLLCNVFMSMK